MRKMLAHAVWGRVFAVFLMLVGLGCGWWLTALAMSSIQELRQLERVPASKVAAALPGEINISATARTLNERILSSHHTHTPSLYYRFRHEVETRDSEGRTSWSTRQDFERGVDFLLEDETGSITLAAASDLKQIDWSVHQSYQTVSGRNRYTEWRIEPFADVFVFAKAVGKGDKLRLRFNQPGHYTPIVSTYGQNAEQQDMGSGGLFALWGGLALLCIGVLGVIYLLQVHRLLVYLSVLTGVLALVLIQLALTMMQQDIKNGLQRYQSHLHTAEQLMSSTMKAHNDSWSGWVQAGDFLDTALPYSEQQRLREVRLTLALSQQRLQQQMQANPERWLLSMWDVKVPSALPGLPADDTAEVNTRLTKIKSTKLNAGWLWAVIPIGMLLALLFTWLGFRQVRYKRMIENVPTSLAAGVSCGVSEVQGSLLIDDDQEPLRSPHTHSRCAWYYYKEEERRGSGKNAKWVTLKEKTDYLTFYSEDETGRLAIDAKDADVISRYEISERQGRMRYTEQTLRMSDPLYAIGMADVDRHQPDRLKMVRGDTAEPFILSNLTEATVMLMKARRGMFYLSLAFSGLLLALLMSFGSSGGFAATDFLLAALAAPVYMMAVTLILHYNDLIFLRRRAERNWANIQISLKKRHTLIPNLEKLAKRYLTHEKEVMKKVAALRKTYKQSVGKKETMGRYFAAEQSADQQLRAVIENYPELKGSKVVSKLMSSLSRMENEVALFRSGYNDAVEIYNARVATVPDVFFARMFGFKRLVYIAD